MTLLISEEKASPDSNFEFFFINFIFTSRSLQTRIEKLNLLHPLHGGYLVECQVSKESMGILYPGTVFWRSNVVRNWYQNVKYPLIPEKSGRRRGIPREGDKSSLTRIPTGSSRSTEPQFHATARNRA
jgi:hypothetical protein